MGVAQAFFTPKRDENIYISNIYLYIFSRATLNETYTAKYGGVLPRTPQVRPKSVIYTPKRDDEHLHSFHMPCSSPRAKAKEERLDWWIPV